MAIAEVFLSAFISVLFDKLASGELMKLARRGGIGDKLKKWKQHLANTAAILSDAEEKQVTQMSVQFWLKDLRDLAYDIDDVLDELATEVLRRELRLAGERGSSSSTSKVWKLIPTCCVNFTPSAVMFDHSISSKIDEITCRWDDLANRRGNLMLIQNVRGELDITGEGSRITTSLVEESRVFGRVKDKAAIIQLLLGDGVINRPGDVRVIPIVGMGGLGKTTLAQLVYNDEQVKDQFVLKAWVCVGEDFDLFKMTKIIYCSGAGDDKEEFKDLNSVQVSLKKKLSNKKFLIVLDDIWNEKYDKWDLFRAPFLVGAPGSTIIVTTRNDNIARFMGSVEAYQLQLLEDNDCLSLIAQHALRSPNFEMHPDLKEVGEEIAKKCKGLPLAAKALGGVLCNKVSLKHWKDVLTSKIWDLPGGSNDIIPALRLSYHHLPPHIKHLFSYCSIFPKDYQFDKEELILLWMAEGFLRPSGKKDMEELGSVTFQELLSRSFFQQSSESSYVMHDLMNDLAQFIAGEICFRLDDDVERVEQNEVFPKWRHSSFIRHRYDAFKNFTKFGGARGLRTFFPLPVHQPPILKSYLSSMVLTDLLPKLHYLRVMSFSGYEIYEVPNSIGDLKHLRYLNLSGTKITQVPESVCQLFNLQTILLRGCDNLIRLPKNFRKLLNLRHLDIEDTSNLEKMPFGFGMLTSLRTLSKIVIDEGEGLKLSEMKGLKDLQGVFCIDGMQNVKNVQDAAEAELSGKKGIKELILRWSSNFDDFQDEGLGTDVLELLKPQEGLERLKIESYRGTNFPSWVGDPSFSSLVHLTLSNCRNCTSLPSLGHLNLLRELFIKDMDGVNTVGAEFLGADLPGVSAFSSLETLSFERMAGWEEWSAHLATGDRNVEGVFSRLAKLEITDCPKLIKVSLPLTPSLVELELINCSEVVVGSLISLGSVKTLCISDISGLTQLDAEAIQFLGALEDLTIRDCGDMKFLWQDVACQRLIKLRELQVSNCGLISLGEKEQALPHKLENLYIFDCANLEQIPSCCMNLRTLSIYNCNKLQYMPLRSEDHQTMATITECSKGVCNLEDLAIGGCWSLTSLPTGKKLPTSLKSLYIYHCMNLEELEEDSESSLESIHIHNWAKLKSLGWFFDNNRYFRTCLTSLSIGDCDNLKYLCDDNQMMQSLESLQELSISNCKNLESFPDEVWPPKLKSLYIGGVKKPITEWGLHSLPTSLNTLFFWGEIPELVSFSVVGSQIRTTSLVTLGFNGLKNLESLSGLQNFTSLEILAIQNCPKLQSLPEMLLPSLLHLHISGCPHLKQRCMMKKRRLLALHFTHPLRGARWKIIMGL